MVVLLFRPGVKCVLVGDLLRLSHGTVTFENSRDTVSRNEALRAIRVRGLEKLLLLEANNQGIRKRGVDEMQFGRFGLLAITLHFV